MVVWLGVLLQAASVAFAQTKPLPKPIYPPGPYNITVTYDTQGRPWKIVDGTTVLGQYAYDGNNAAPVAYTSPDGRIHWVTNANRAWIVAYTSIITPAITEAEVDSLVASLNTGWKTTPIKWQTTGVTPPENYTTCIAKCDSFWFQVASVCTAITAINRGWGAKCFAAAILGAAACRNACAVDPPGPFEFVWCRGWPQPPGTPQMGGHPENCGADPIPIVEKGCEMQGPGVYVHDIQNQNGGFRVNARCYYNHPTLGPQYYGFSYADYMVICNTVFFMDVAQIWYNHPIDTLKYVCP